MPFLSVTLSKSILSLCKTVGKTEERKRLDLERASTRFLLYSQSQWKEQVYILKIILLKYHIKVGLGCLAEPAKNMKYE